MTINRSRRRREYLGYGIERLFDRRWRRLQALYVLRDKPEMRARRSQPDGRVGFKHLLHPQDECREKSLPQTSSSGLQRA